jgi:hypothetical protein
MMKDTAFLYIPAKGFKLNGAPHRSFHLVLAFLDRQLPDR